MLEKENLPALLLGLAVGLASAPDPMAVGDSLLGRVGESAGGGVFLQSVAISCPRLGSLLLALGEDIVFGRGENLLCCSSLFFLQRWEGEGSGSSGLNLVVAVSQQEVSMVLLLALALLLCLCALPALIPAPVTF